MIRIHTQISMSSPKTIAGIVSKIDQLKQLVDTAEALTRLDRVFQGCLPSKFTGHVHLAAVRDGCAIVQAESSAWATELRYITPQLLQSMSENAEFNGIKSIRVRKRQAELEAVQPKREVRISAEAAADMNAMADQLSDGDLGEALKKLAKRASAASADSK